MHGHPQPVAPLTCFPCIILIDVLVSVLTEDVCFLIVPYACLFLTGFNLTGRQQWTGTKVATLAVRSFLSALFLCNPESSCVVGMLWFVWQREQRCCLDMPWGMVVSFTLQRNKKNATMKRTSHSRGRCKRKKRYRGPEMSNVPPINIAPGCSHRWSTDSIYI